MKNNTLLFLSLFLIFASGFQTITRLFPEHPLNGAYTESEKPVISLTSWFDESLQEKAEIWLNENFGFRNLYVRLEHQLSYSVFKKARSNGVVVGKDNYLFEQLYINALYGRDFIGISKWEERIGKLSALSEKFEKLNKSLLICIAPSKAAFYEEYIPNHLKSDGEPSNYLYLTKSLKNENIKVLDFYSWFNDIKAQSPFPLFPKTGIHWSEYGQYLAGDSIFKYFNSLGYKMPEMKLDSIQTTLMPNHQDSDIESAMNLMCPISQDTLAYPYFSFERNDTIKPSGIVVGDSFYWQFLNDGMHKEFFSYGEFWYYNKDIVVPGGSIIKQSTEYLKQRIEKTDLLVLMCSEGGLSKFAWGFIDDLYSLYFDKYSYSPEILKYIEQVKAGINDNSVWLEKVERKAIDKSISLDSMMILEALYLYDQNELKKLNN